MLDHTHMLVTYPPLQSPTMNYIILSMFWICLLQNQKGCIVLLSLIFKPIPRKAVKTLNFSVILGLRDIVEVCMILSKISQSKLYKCDR